MPSPIATALLAAALFGASTPIAKSLLLHGGPLMVAALLYLGSGIGLAFWMLLRRALPRQADNQSIAAPDLPWLAAVVLFGGILGPVLLMLGLSRTDAASASLLLNMEAVLTALMAWLLFREAFDRRIATGMVLIVAAGVLLSLERGAQYRLAPGALLVIGACLCWAIDNNLTRRISGNDAVQIAAVKGVAAGTVNLALALWSGSAWPGTGTALLVGVVGLLGYGFSLVLFVTALRQLGTARTGAYFATAPFAGAALSLLMFSEPPPALFWPAALLMAIGLWLHISERHSHFHRHEPMEHTHLHVHDEHHQHAHDFDWDGQEPHAHPHRHEAMEHSHPHYPDLHHRHRH